MGLEKSLIICSLIILIIINFISADPPVSPDGCDISIGQNIISYADTISVPPENIVIMNVSGAVNAHADVFSGTVSIDKIYLACNFAGSRTCDKNSIFGLSSQTNAHINFPKGDYPVEICFGDLICTKETRTDACPSTHPIKMASLSSSSGTNSHIGNFYAYPTKICCRHSIPSTTCGDGIKNGDDVCDETDFGGKTCRDFGFDSGELMCESDCQGINTGKCVANPEPLLKWSKLRAKIGETVEMRVTGIPEGIGIIHFKIKEEDTYSLDDELNTTIIATVSAEHSANASWKITSSDLSKGLGIEDKSTGNLDNIYFIVDEISGISDNLRLQFIVDEKDVCKDFKEEDSCNNVGINSPIAIASNPDSASLRCGASVPFTGAVGCTYIYNCDCVWENNNCSFSSSPSTTPECSNPSIGSCTAIEATADNCDDDFLEYNWTGNWNWATGNDFGNNSCIFPRNTESYRVIGGKCRFDPITSSGKRYSETCVSGSKIVPCPAQVKLPIFGFYNILSVIIIVFIVYFILNQKSKMKDSLKRRYYSEKT